ncbi:glutamine amidotransferase [Thermococcus celericrescens]|uniref:Glutamine amidotransferase n=1 Tax=Thermococcus celericrescens TaxID=227598 RepID=A0A100XYM0_9EURY|nr:class II glutamine amidotransferase [Thermococcus celericrescens]KUH33951.1 glutamine amidotransferase [Thermococcus celericrescens]
MCRVMFAAGDGKRIRPLLDALVRSSENDPYKERRGRGNQHRDGWGYVLLKEGSVKHYRSLRPIFEDAAALGSLREELEGFAVLMAHTRAASQGARNLFNVHPFAFSSRHGFTFWLLHNGDLDKERIMELAELDGEELGNVSDTYAFATYLCRRLPSPSLDDVLEQYRIINGTMKSLFNTVTLFQDSGGRFSAFITASMSEKYAENPLNYDYGRLLLIEGEDLFAVTSSTFELYHPADYRVIPNGTAFYVRLGEDGFDVETVHL